MSRIKYRTLDSKESIERHFGCAAPIKGLHASMIEYEYILESVSVDIKIRNKWFEFISKLGLELEYDSTRLYGLVKLKNLHAFTTEMSILWAHSLIRMVEEDSPIVHYMNSVLIVRDRPELADLDNYQIMQYTLWFITRATDKSPVFTHLIFSTYRSSNILPSTLVTIDEVYDRFNMLHGVLGLNGISSIYSKIDEIDSRLAISGNVVYTLERLAGGNNILPSTEAQWSKSLTFVSESLVKLGEYKVKTAVMCVKIGANDGLILGNTYSLVGIPQPYNSNLSKVRDAFGRFVTNRHFKLIG